MGVPEYYYAKPRYDGVAVPPQEVDKNATSWSVLPNSVREAYTAALSLGSALALNARFSSQSIPYYKGVQLIKSCSNSNISAT